MGKNISKMTNQIYILPDRKRPDPDEVAAAFNKKVEEELRREALKKKLGQKTENKLEEKVDKTETKIPASLEDICEGYEEFMAWKRRDKIIPTEITNKYNPTSEQIKQFSEILVKYSDSGGFVNFTANYLTALMLSSQDKDFVINLTELNKKNIELNYLGLGLKGKNLTINGNARYHVGYDAKNCQITINGNAGDYVGSDAENCQITINGSARGWVGHDAENCPITINGNAGDYVGNNAKNCPITINGNAGNGVGWSAKNCPITINGNARYDVGHYAKNCQIKIKGKIGSLSGYIGKDTEIYKWKNNNWEKIYPK